MKALSRDAWLAIVLFTLLVAVTAVAAARELGSSELPLSSLSSEPNGARALRLWLSALDYEVGHDVSDGRLPPEAAAVAFVLQPSTTILPTEWEQFDAWIEGGGTLVAAATGNSLRRLADHFEVDLRVFGAFEPLSQPQSPLLATPPLPAGVETHADFYVVDGPEAMLVHLATSGEAVIVSFPRGAGRVFLSTAVYPFTNEGLDEAGNAELVLNLVSAAAERRVIWFDEWHHGLRERAAEDVGPLVWLRRTPVGRSLLYVFAVAFTAVALAGRRFGRPVPLPDHVARRAPLEYVDALANLSRRAGHRAATLDYYHQTLKRELGRRYRLSPALPDDEFVERLGAYDPTLDREALAALLRQLRRRSMTEPDMIRLASLVADWLERRA